jgi:hypothetical protein
MEFHFLLLLGARERMRIALANYLWLKAILSSAIYISTKPR